MEAKKYWIFTFVLIGFACVWSGCSSTGEHVRWYSGPPRPTNEIVILKIQREPYPALLQKIDGKPFRGDKLLVRYNTKEIELSSGSHQIEVWFADTLGRRAYSNIVLNVNFQLGHEYELHTASSDDNRSFGHDLKEQFIPDKAYWTAWISDDKEP